MELVDPEKAYANVPKEIWKEMENTDIKSILIESTANLYVKNTTRTKVGSKLTEVFQTSERLTQGCCRSHTQFEIYMDRILRGWQRKCRNMGVQVGDGILYVIYFVKEQIAIAEHKDN
jgi:hypothetical protein